VCSSSTEAKNLAIERYRQYGQIQELIVRCNQLLAKKMAAAALEFNDYREQHGSFPEEGDETRSLETKLSVSAGENVYHINEAEVSAAAASIDRIGHSGKGACAVRILVDLSLSPLRVAQYKQNPPSSWIAAPGTITIIHNTEKAYIVWGAGNDGRPIKQGNQSELVLVTGSLQ
jgi:hypothetical protein